MFFNLEVAYATAPDSRLDESTTYCSCLNCSRIRPHRNNLGVSPDPFALARCILPSHRTRLTDSSDRDDRTLTSMGQHSRQDRERKQDSTPPASFPSTAQWRLCPTDSMDEQSVDSGRLHY